MWQPYFNDTSEISKLEYRKEEVGINETMPNKGINGKNILIHYSLNIHSINTSCDFNSMVLSALLHLNFSGKGANFHVDAVQSWKNLARW